MPPLLRSGDWRQPQRDPAGPFLLNARRRTMNFRLLLPNTSRVPEIEDEADRPWFAARLDLHPLKITRTSEPTGYRVQAKHVLVSRKRCSFSSQQRRFRLLCSWQRRGRSDWAGAFKARRPQGGLSV